MIFNFRVVSDEVDNFKREIQIDADATFLDLKNAICDAVDYDKNLLCSFFLCDNNWEKEKEFTAEDMDSDADLMEDCVLRDYIDDEGQRLIFTYDYLTDRSFFIEMKSATTGRTLKDPVCTLSVGKAPSQDMDIDTFEQNLDKKTAKKAADVEIDEEFYGSNEFNPDEFDAAGFDEMTFDE